LRKRALTTLAIPPVATGSHVHLAEADPCTNRQRAWTNTAKAFCGLGRLGETPSRAAAASFAAATTTWDYWRVGIAGKKAFLMHSPLYRWTVAAIAVATAFHSRFNAPLRGLSIGGRSPSWLVYLNCSGCGKRSSANPARCLGTRRPNQSLPHDHSTPLLSPTPASTTPSRSIALPYRQYHGAIPDPPPNNVACGDLTSAQSEARLVRNSHMP
jgi:hypothetical protein